MNEAVLDELDASRAELVELAAELVRAPSVTGAEGAAADVCERWLVDAGFTVRTAAPDPGEPDRRNVYGWSRPPSGRPVLALNGHVDVIPPGEGWTRAPFGGTVEAGRLWGRGAADMKGGLACGMMAARALREADLQCDVVVQCVIAEETGGQGTLFALEGEPHLAAAIVLEPTDGVAASACGGMVPFALEVTGRPTHTSVPWMGASAYERLAVVHEALAGFTAERSAACTHPLFAGLPEKAPLAVGKVRAGGHWGTIPARARMEGRVGVLPGEDTAGVRAGAAAAVAAAAERAGWPGDVTLQFPIDGMPVWETPEHEPIVGALRAAAGAGSAGALTFGSDAGHLAAAGVPTVLFGPGRIGDAHVPDEHVEIAKLHEAARVVALTVLEYSRRIDGGAA
jgi:acetylornithine deacetylase